MLPQTAALEVSNASKLAFAAEELVKAACTSVEASSLTLGQESVACLKRLSLGSESTEKTIANLADNINALTMTLSNFKEEVGSYFDLQTRNQRLLWAFDHTELLSFKYYHKGCNDAVDSAALVKIILLGFLNGKGFGIVNRSVSREESSWEEGERRFHEKLMAQIGNLTGVQPYLEKEDGHYSIFYSKALLKSYSQDSDVQEPEDGN